MAKQESDERPWTVSIPAAGRKYYGVGRATAYELARDGTMPTIDLGPKLKRALPRVIEAQLAAKTSS
jgi:hypothetical protein